MKHALIFFLVASASGVVEGQPETPPLTVARNAIGEYRRSKKPEDLLKAFNLMQETSAHPSSPAFLQERVEKLGLSIDLLNEIDSIVVPHIDEQALDRAREAVTEKLPFYFSGMSSEAIQDPQLRAAYKRVGLEEARQRELVRWKNRLQQYHRETIQEIESLVTQKFNDAPEVALGIIDSKLGSSKSRTQIKDLIQRRGRPR